MSVNLRKQLTNIQKELKTKNNIPITDFKTAFMITTGYGKQKVNEWTQTFYELGLIDIQNGEIVNIV